MCVCVQTAVQSYLLFLTALIVGMCLANQVEIFLVEQGIFGFALLPSALLSLAAAFAALFVVFLVLVYDETFADLQIRLEQRRGVEKASAPLARLLRRHPLLPRWNHRQRREPFASWGEGRRHHPQSPRLLPRCRSQRRDRTSWRWPC